MKKSLKNSFKTQQKWLHKHVQGLVEGTGFSRAEEIKIRPGRRQRQFNNTLWIALCTSDDRTCMSVTYTARFS